MPARAATAPLVLICLLVLGLAGLAGTATWAAEDEPRSLAAVDLARILELYHLTDVLGDDLWPGFDTRKIPIAVNVNDREEILVGHPNPPPEYHACEDHQLDGQPVMIREGTTKFSPRGMGRTIKIGGVESGYYSIRPEDRSTEEYLVVLLHEAFHCFQQQYRQPPDGYRPGDFGSFLPDAVQSALLELGSRVLQATLDEPDGDKARELARTFVAVRHERRKDLSADHVLFEDEQEYGEGTATYAHVRMLQLLAARGGIQPVSEIKDPHYRGFANVKEMLAKETAELIASRPKPKDFEWAMYRHGCAQGLILDRFRPAWKEEIREQGMTPFTLFKREFPVTKEEEGKLLAAAKRRFGYDDLLADQERKIAAHLDALRGLVDVPGRHYRIFHQDVPGRPRMKFSGSPYFISPALEKELAAKWGVPAPDLAFGERMVWAGGIDAFEIPGTLDPPSIPPDDKGGRPRPSQGLVFSIKGPAIMGYDYVEWIDPDPAADRSDLVIEAERQENGVYFGLKLTRGGLRLEADKARIEWSRELVEIRALPLADQPTGPTGQETAPAAGPESADYQTRARRLAREILIIDGHVDAPYAQQEAPADLSVEAPDRQFDYPRAKAGGLDVPFMSIFTPPRIQAEEGANKRLADELIDWLEQLVAAHPDKFAIPSSAADVEAHFAAGKISLPMGLENGAPIEDDLANLRHFHERGIRYVTLAHSEPNLICDSSFSEKRPWKGLSPFGREVVAEMNRLGIMVDVSHVSDETFYQVVELSQAPVIASHSSCRKFTPGWERNIADDMIRRLAATGGVVEITFGSGFLLAEANQQGMAYWSALEKFRQHSGAKHGSPEEAKFNEEYWRDKTRIWADVSDVADHIDHVVGLVGIDHVGLGSDFEGLGDTAPTGLKDVAAYPNLIAELLARGYSEEDLRKICGGNLLRVWKEVERVAAELRSGG